MSMGYSSAIGSEGDVEKQYPAEDIPEFCNIQMEKLLCIGAKTAVDICGLGIKPIHDITIRESYIQAEQGVKCRLCENIRFEDVSIAVGNRRHQFERECISGTYQSED